MSFSYSFTELEAQVTPGLLPQRSSWTTDSLYHVTDWYKLYCLWNCSWLLRDGPLWLKATNVCWGPPRSQGHRAEYNLSRLWRTQSLAGEMGVSRQYNHVCVRGKLKMLRGTEDGQLTSDGVIRKSVLWERCLVSLILKTYNSHLSSNIYCVPGTLKTLSCLIHMTVSQSNCYYSCPIEGETLQEMLICLKSHR